MRRPAKLTTAYATVIANTSRDRHMWKEGSYPASLPHVAVAGRSYWRSNPRILIVGKAGAVSESFESGPKNLVDYLESRSPNVGDLPGLSARVERYWDTMLNVEVPKYYGDSEATNLSNAQPWWQEIYRLVAPLRGIDTPADTPMSRGAMDAKRVFQSIAWANLLKVDLGGGAARPSRKNLKWHAESGGLLLLRDELEWLRPNVVIFATGPSFDETMTRAGFGVGKLNVEPPLKRVHNVNTVPIAPLRDGTKPIALRCYHFEVKESGLSRKEMYLGISRWIASQQ